MVYVLICSRPCYISSCGRRDGEAIRDKGFAHVSIVEFKALDQVYRICIAHGMFGKEIHECTPIFMGHVDMGGEGISMRPIGDPSGGIVRKWFQSFVYGTMSGYHG